MSDYVRWPQPKRRGGWSSWHVVKPTRSLTPRALCRSTHEVPATYVTAAAFPGNERTCENCFRIAARAAERALVD
jgi:hypothetical protein